MCPRGSHCFGYYLKAKSQVLLTYFGISKWLMPQYVHHIMYIYLRKNIRLFILAVIYCLHGLNFFKRRLPFCQFRLLLHTLDKTHGGWFCWWGNTWSTFEKVFIFLFKGRRNIFFIIALWCKEICLSLRLWLFHGCSESWCSICIKINKIRYALQCLLKSNCIWIFDKFGRHALGAPNLSQTEPILMLTIKLLEVAIVLTSLLILLV